MPSASTAARATSAAFPPASLGQTCASATPNAGGSAVSRSVTVSGWNSPRTEKALTVTSGPSTSSSTMRRAAAGLRDRARDRGRQLVLGADERQTLLPLPVGRLDDAGARTVCCSASSGASTICQLGCGTPASARRSRCFCFETRELGRAARSDAAGRSARRPGRRSRPASRSRARSPRRRPPRRRGARCPARPRSR